MVIGDTGMKQRPGKLKKEIVDSFALECAVRASE